MKKLLSLVMATVMLATMSLSAFAAPADLKGVVTGLGKTPPIIRNTDVPVDIQVDVEQTGTFVDGPVNKTISGNSVLADYKATMYMETVRTLYQVLVGAAELAVAGETALETRLDNCQVTGQFVVKITYPENAVVPTEITEGTGCFGFNAPVLNAFTETVPRTVTPGADGTKVLTMTLDVKPVAKSVMSANLEAYLPDLVLTCEGIGLNLGENKVVGTITGYTKIHDGVDHLYTINYNGKQGTDVGITGSEISETVTLVRDDGITVVPPSSVDTGKENPKVTVVVGGGNDNIEITPEKDKVNADEIAEQVKDAREGFVLKGIYDSQTGGNKLEGDVVVDKDTKVYVQWINITVPSKLNGDDHIQYIHGYPDETVRPENNVSREEVATMFYRLLKEEIRAEIKTNVNSFSDVESDRWSNNAISTMANGGFVKGYEDGTFRPEDYITRAELATIASRFLDAAGEGEITFNDIEGHWAEENIESIANNAWILGYEDGAFRPDEYITRAETITIINRILVRYVNEKGLEGDEKQWIDNPVDAWYYHAIMEATHEHNHERAEDKYNELWSESNSEMLVD